MQCLFLVYSGSHAYFSSRVCCYSVQIMSMFINMGIINIQQTDNILSLSVQL